MEDKRRCSLVVFPCSRDISIHESWESRSFFVVEKALVSFMSSIVHRSCLSIFVSLILLSFVTLFEERYTSLEQGNPLQFQRKLLTEDLKKCSWMYTRTQQDNVLSCVFDASFSAGNPAGDRFENKNRCSDLKKNIFSLWSQQQHKRMKGRKRRKRLSLETRKRE